MMKKFKISTICLFLVFYLSMLTAIAAEIPLQERENCCVPDFEDMELSLDMDDDGATDLSPVVTLWGQDVETELYQRLEQGMMNQTGLHDEARISLLDLGLPNAKEEDGDNSGWDVFIKSWRRVLFEHPEFFYIRGYTVYNKTINGQRTINTVQLHYQEYAREPGAIEAYNNAVDAALAQVDGIENPLEQMLVLHNYLVTNNVYNWQVAAFGTGTGEPPYVYNSYGALVMHDTVCAGYAKAYRVLLTRLNIPCYVIHSSKLGHAWNLVELDGEWYHVDVNNGNSVVPAMRGRCTHRRFLMSDTFAREHGLDADDWYIDAETGKSYDTLPECTSTKYESGWAFNGGKWGTEYALYRQADGSYYHLERTGFKTFGLYHGALNEKGILITTLYPYNWYTPLETGGYSWHSSSSGIVWLGDYLYYTDVQNVDVSSFPVKGILTSYCLTDGSSTALGTVVFDPQPSADGKFTELCDAISLFYDAEQREIVASSRSRWDVEFLRVKTDNTGKAYSAAAEADGNSLRLIIPAETYPNGTLCIAARYDNDNRMTMLATGVIGNSRAGVTVVSMSQEIRPGDVVFFLEGTTWKPLRPKLKIMAEQ